MSPPPPEWSQYRDIHTTWKGARWTLPYRVATLHVGFAWDPVAAQVDRDWPPLRAVNAPNRHWLWREFVIRCRDRVVVYDETGTAVALWGSKANGPLVLGENRAYRLDYIEVHPDHRDYGVGLFAMALVADRALRDGCDCVVLGSLDHPDTLNFYEKLGGRHDAIPGNWQCDVGLKAFYIDEAALRRLKRFLDGVRVAG